jgi:hypothetical protein
MTSAANSATQSTYPRRRRPQLPKAASVAGALTVSIPVRRPRERRGQKISPSVLDPGSSRTTGYDSNTIHRQVEERGAMPNIAPEANRKWKNCFSPFLYRYLNAI